MQEQFDIQISYYTDGVNTIDKYIKVKKKKKD